MTQAKDPASIKQLIEQTFNSIAESYDCPEMRYFRYAADYMINLSKIPPGSRVCDVAAGTGMVTIAAAKQVRSSDGLGRVQAIDFSEAMLKKAERNIQKYALENVDMHVMDAEKLEFRSDYFDLICCGFGIFFLPAPEKAIEKWQRILKPGGQIIFSTFADSAFMPMARWFKEDVESLGVEYPDKGWQPFSKEEDCLALLDAERFKKQTITRKQHGIHLKDEHEWWRIISSSGYRAILDMLKPEQQAKLQDIHSKRVAELKNDQGVWVDVDVIYTQGWKRC